MLERDKGRLRKESLGHSNVVDCLRDAKQRSYDQRSTASTPKSAANSSLVDNPSKYLEQTSLNIKTIRTKPLLHLRVSDTCDINHMNARLTSFCRRRMVYKGRLQSHRRPLRKGKTTRRLTHFVSSSTLDHVNSSAARSRPSDTSAKNGK